MHLRCPACGLPLTSEEMLSGFCPVCEGALPVETNPVPEKPSATPASSGSKSLYLFGMATLLILAGGAAGFSLRPHVLDAPESPVGTTEAPTENSTPVAADALKAAEEITRLSGRLKGLENHVEEIRKERDRLQKDLQAARLAARKAEADAHIRSESIREMENRVTELSRELDQQKKLTAEAQAQAGKTSPADDRVMALEALAARQVVELRNLKNMADQARNREEAVRRNLEQVRREGRQALDHLNQHHQRTINQVQQQHQRTVDQMRQQHQQALERGRRELQQQRIETQKAREAAAREKKAAEEARRKK